MRPSAPYAEKHRAEAVLHESGSDFSVSDALALLSDVKQEGKWATRVSFVYSRNENAVYYFPNGDGTMLERHRLGVNAYEI